MTMAKTEELEKQEKDLPGYGTPSDAYDEEEWEQQMVKGWPRPLHTFGVRQNQINRGTAARLRALEIQNRALEIKTERLEKELEAYKDRERSIFGRVAAEMDKMEAEINRLRLSVKLNSNALERLIRGSQKPAESDAEEQE